MKPGGFNDNSTGIIKESSEILKELYASKEAGNILGIWSSSRLANDLMMCIVESIHEDDLENDKAIIIKEIRANGAMSKRHLLTFRQIEKVHQFKTM